MTYACKLGLLAGSIAVAGSAFAAPVAEGGRRFAINLTGAAECNTSGVCGIGDPDGSGIANLTVNLGQQRVCYDISVSNIALPTTGAHIHRAPAGSAPAGNIVVHLAAPGTGGTSSGCVENVSRELIRAMLTNPANYYVNVHTTGFGGGAVRGQLSHRPR